jgi:hypothetical protein
VAIFLACQLRELGRVHAFLKLFRESTLKRLRLHFFEDALFFQEVVESGTGT